VVVVVIRLRGGERERRLLVHLEEDIKIRDIINSSSSSNSKDPTQPDPVEVQVEVVDSPQVQAEEEEDHLQALQLLSQLMILLGG
jgi:hypothetical protein